MNNAHTLYAMPHSLYSGRARSYLIKNRIPFRELSTGHESFKAEILPQAKIPTIPTLKTADGLVIRDGTAIIEHFAMKLETPNSRRWGEGQKCDSMNFSGPTRAGREL